MSYEDAANTIRGRFKTLIADGESVDVQYDNAEYDPGDEVWVRCTIRPGSSEQVSHGRDSGFAGWDARREANAWWFHA